MKKALIAFLLALTVSGCGTFGTYTNPVTTDRLTSIKQGYGIALSGAVAYRDACAQRLIPPSCRIVVPQLVAANRKVVIALANLSRLQALGPTVDITSALSVLSSAVVDLQLLVPAGSN
jgi:hypothetical protein